MTGQNFSAPDGGALAPPTSGAEPANGGGGQGKVSSDGAIRPVMLWDPLVRITHWGLALAVLANGLILKPGGSVHIWIGWAVLGLLAVRLGWGFLGPAEARFSSFPLRPRAALGHLRALLAGRVDEHPSHNPAGAVMVYALWAALAVTVATGIVMTGGRSPIAIAEEKAAVAAGDWSVLVKDGEEAEEDDKGGFGALAEDIHEGAVNLMLILAVIHVAGVAIEGRALGRNLVAPMMFGAPGRKTRRRS